MVQSNPENIGNSYQNSAKDHMRHVVPTLSGTILTLEKNNFQRLAKVALNNSHPISKLLTLK